MSEEMDIRGAVAENVSADQSEPSEIEQRTNRFQRRGERTILNTVRGDLGGVGTELETISAQLRSVSMPAHSLPRTLM
ncbi:hypothetical protein EGM85_12300 [Macrococcus caseolyticus]|nr:hypothetical protein [Macrococcus caseolyticus]RKO09454.1 hypothetical protein D6861_12300 [Macrococcus caseolyticus]